MVQRHAVVSAVAAVAVLLLASPALDMRLGSSDAGNNPESLHSRRAFDLLSEGFGPGFNGPFIVAHGQRRGGARAGGRRARRG